MAVRLAGVKSASMEFVFMTGLKWTATFLARSCFGLRREPGRLVDTCLRPAEGEKITTFVK